VEEGRQSDAKYEGLSIQEKTSMEVDGKICGAVYDRGGSIVEWGKIMITKFDENSSGSKCKLDSLIEGASEGTEEQGRKTGRDGRS